MLNYIIIYYIILKIYQYIYITLYKYVLKDGVSVGFYNNSTIYVDVDGPHKGYNTLGIDIFAFPVTSEGNLSYSMNLASFNNTFLSSCKGGTEMNCTAWAMTFDNIDYTKCSDLSYSKTTCKQNIFYKTCIIQKMNYARNSVIIARGRKPSIRECKVL